MAEKSTQDMQPTLGLTGLTMNAMALIAPGAFLWLTFLIQATAGAMVGVMGMLCGYLVGTIWPTFMSASLPGPAFMMLVAVVFSFAIAYIASRGVNGSTAVNIAINVIQITALVVFSVLALGYRMNHPPGTVAFQFDSTSGEAYSYEFASEKQMVNGQPTDVVLRDK